MADTCRSCDGRKYIEREDKDNVMRKVRKACSRCNASGNEPEPSKGKRPFFRKRDPDEEPSIEEMTRAFLRKHGR